jgi:type III secretion protein R
MSPRVKKRVVAIAALLLFSLALSFSFPAAAHAQQPPRGGAPAVEKDEKPGLSKPLMSIIVLGALSLAPFVLVMTTSFLKFSVVGSIIRSALGTQQIPPNQVLMGLSLILTVYVMSPTGKRIYDEVKDVIDRGAKKGVFSDESVDIFKEAIERGKKPYLDFLARHSHAKDRELFVYMARQLRKNEKEPTLVDQKDPLVLIAAFVTSELTEAFQIGFIIFVPFIVIDMIVSNVLLAMGMQMLSPQTISLPCKLLLFVLSDGWHLIMKGLVLGYA